MSTLFRSLLQKVGSGQHTSKDLTRPEAAQATRMILLEEATPAQIGAFLISHRIKRPTAAEMAGLLDAYEELGPTLPSLDLPNPLLIFGHPYDGRSRTAPLAPLVALILATAGSTVLLHGADRCPTKYGLPLVEIWQGLGIDWRSLELTQLADVLQRTGIGFLYMPHHFPLAQRLMEYRDQIGKRPPFATLELTWAPYQGEFHLISGFVHPPTEATMLETFRLRGVEQFTTVKGLEGSCDLPRDRTAILSLGHERLLLKPRDYQMEGSEVPLASLEELLAQIRQVLAGQVSELTTATLWNGGFYLWRAGHTADVATGIAQVREMLVSGQVSRKLEQLQTQVTAVRSLLIP